jgi:hypothetical protein
MLRLLQIFFVGNVYENVEQREVNKRYLYDELQGSCLSSVNAALMRLSGTLDGQQATAIMRILENLNILAR